MGVRRKTAILIVCAAVAIMALCGSTLAQPAGAATGATIAKKRATKSCKHKRHKHHRNRHGCAKRKLPPPRCDTAGSTGMPVICLPPPPPPEPIPVPGPCPPCLDGPCAERDVMVICDPPPCPPPCPSPGIHCPLQPVALYYPCAEPAVK